jgi:hypothetical protein
VRLTNVHTHVVLCGGQCHFCSVTSTREERVFPPRNDRVELIITFFHLAAREQGLLLAQGWWVVCWVHGATRACGQR